MNSMSGLSVLKKPFSWKFGYPRFQKKMKVHFLEKEDGSLRKGSVEDFPWDDVFPSDAVLDSSAPVSDFCWDFARAGEPDQVVDSCNSSSHPDEVEYDDTPSTVKGSCDPITKKNHSLLESDGEDRASSASGASSTACGPNISSESQDPAPTYSAVGIGIGIGAPCRGFEDADDGLGDEDPVYENADCLLLDEPLYENYVNPKRSSLSEISQFNEYCNAFRDHGEFDDDFEEEHIYEHVHHHRHHQGPVNVFLALLQSPATISPDPNIYEVPPGAIRRDCLFDDKASGRNITPPSGFQDYEKLSWVRAAGSIRSSNTNTYYDDLNSNFIHVDYTPETLRDAVLKAAAQKEEDRVKLPVEVIYSTIVKPRRKKKRPPISAMLQIASAAGILADDSGDKDSKIVTETIDDCAISWTHHRGDAKHNYTIVDGTETISGDVTVLSVLPDSEKTEAIAEGGSENVVIVTPPTPPPLEAEQMRELVIVTPPTPPVVSDEEDAVIQAEDLAAVIEIGDDGSWDTKKIPPTQVDVIKQQEDLEESGQVTFLTPVGQECLAETAKIKHVTLTYGSQYYVNCAKKECQRTVVEVNKVDDPTDGKVIIEVKVDDNIGAQIMKQYEQDRQKVRESLNLPDVSLLDMDESVEDLERERRRVIVNQAVRAKRINSWIKSNSATQIQDGYVDRQQEHSIVKNRATPPSFSQSFRIESAVLDLPDDRDKEGLLEIADKLNIDGEVVYDSILLNKQKTKTYWEQLMMAAAASEASLTPPVTPSTPMAPVMPRDLPSLGSEPAGSELSEQDYFDARSQEARHDGVDGFQVSLSSPPEPVDGEERSAPAPKIVETVAKKLESAAMMAAQTGPRGESVIEREIRQQREREEQVAREREAALQHTALDLLRDDGFVSIPTTDEGNFSEYGSEEKEQSIDGNNSSRVMSPEVGAVPHHHQRTQSMDSTSSGHSSGSGSGSGSGGGFPGRRRVTVKPLAEPEDHDTPAYIRTTSETPIEREIRLVREREAELAREKALRLGLTPPAPISIIPSGDAVVRDGVDTRESVRNATNRIQQEISRAAERENELRHSKDAPRVNGQSEYPDRVKLKKAVSTSHIPMATETTTPVDPPVVANIHSTSTPQQNGRPNPRKNLGRSISAAPIPVSTPLNTMTLGPRRFATNPNQKGIMQRFIASRGKMSSSVLMNSINSSGSSISPSGSFFTSTPVHLPPSAITVTLSPAVTAKMAAMVDTAASSPATDRSDHSPTPIRRGYTSAEDKIQQELKEMRRREEELRLQRARTFARSQPNLLSIGDGEDTTDAPMTNGDDSIVDKLPTMATLRSALSNPNLLDDDAPNGIEATNEKNCNKNSGIRKRSALIAQWENRIQQHIVEH